MKGKDLTDSLVALGKKKGMITFEELEDTFPAEYCPLEEMEQFLRRLDHLGIRVVEGRRHKRTGHHHRQAA